LFQFNVTAYNGGVMLTDSVPFAINAVIGQPVYGSGVHLRGTGTPETTISITANGGTTVLGTGIVDGNGKFDLITSPLADGIYSLQAVSQGRRRPRPVSPSACFRPRLSSPRRLPITRSTATPSS